MANELSLEEFIRQPDVVDLHAKNDEELLSFLRGREYVRMGKVVSGNNTVIYVRRNKIDDVLRFFGQKHLEHLALPLGLLGTESMKESNILETQMELGLKGKGVLIGFIDTGIDYTNKVFLNEDGSSKIKYIWDQSANGSGPKGYHFGTEYTNEQINDALKSEIPRNIVPHQDVVGHGTFLASIACRKRR
ncbi:MAG: hypothetical protein FWC79_02095 [Oscillospiraceae bacterium]|nr:hypothetical protein [Oscillospiraceae bacterium]